MSQPREPTVRVPELGEFRMGDWVVRHTEGTLSLDGRSVRLEPRVMDVLACLAAEPGRVVSKEELLQAVWGGAFVEEGALSQAVHSLRKVLGDDARQPRYIQTIPKRGYRLVVPVSAKGPANEKTERWEATAPVDSEPAGSASLTHSRRQAWLVLVLTGGILAVLLLWAIWHRAGTAFREPEQFSALQDSGKRIVVLPFENLGKPEDAYFADGLSEELTKDLATLPSLQVISRTSAILYQGAHKPLPQIGRELRVQYVLEGTVRWAKGADGRPRVRITPQLIRVADDAHVWAQSYESGVENIFDVQEKISRRVISQLGITLLPGEGEMLKKQPTQNLEAYQAYRRGLHLRNQPFYSESHVRKAVSMLERAVQLDPGSASAWAELSQTQSYLVFNTDNSPARVNKAREARDRALALDSNLPATHLASAYFAYRCERDYESAYRQLAEAARLYPNDAEILQSLGFVLRRLGRFPEAIEALRKAFSLDPLTVKLVGAIAETYRTLRDYEQADSYLNEAIALAPDESHFWEEKALNRFAQTGSTSEARAILAKAPIPEDPGLLLVSFQLDLYDREYERALARLSPERLQSLNLFDQSWLAILAMTAQDRLGDVHSARQTAEENCVALEGRVARFPKEPAYRAYLALALAYLGRDEEALAQADRAVRLLRQDPFTGPYFVEIQAMVEVRLGRRRQAIALLTQLLAIHYRSPLTAAELRLDPAWDRLQGDPAFEALLSQFQD